MLKNANRAVATLCASFALVLTCQAEIDEDAKTVLEDAAAAIKQIESMTCHVHRFGTGPLAVLDFQGDVELIRAGKQGLTRYQAHVDGEVKDPLKGEQHFRVSTDGQYVTWIDEETKTVKEKPLTDRRSGAASQKKFIEYLILTVFHEAQPFRRGSGTCDASVCWA